MARNSDRAAAAQAPAAAPAPSLGRIVLVLGPVARHNGADVAPAVITRVWGEHPDGGHTVNVTVLPDGYAPRHATSVRLLADEQAARESLADERGVAAYWPARV